jgi:hypothetical protein
MKQQHPITPPPELVQHWMTEARSQDYCSITEQVAFHAAQWGADQELDACCEWVSKYLPYLVDFPMPEDKLRAARRPKPPSLKEQALATLQKISKDNYPCSYQDDGDWDTIRRALESIPDPS